MGVPEQNEKKMLELRNELAEIDQRLEAFAGHRSAFQPVTSPPNSQVWITLHRVTVLSNCIENV